ncbi:MAG: hypothetical protein EAZ09_03795 [Oscillatoriales cyanobacterium]|jgi:hypothetical protein|nr:MAG: hypothetical protein EAZ18_01080 [Oscillatoriales cyanobacterium]TAH24622.1 MAG: hypothetical protein EAZ09_03795 [Oscillatoriales cyanobacterium]
MIDYSHFLEEKKRMDTTAVKKAPPQPVEEVKINSINSLEFELWAKAVKRQMIEALSKKSES